MSEDRDFIIHQEYRGSQKPPLVSPLSKLDEEMYNEIYRLNKRMKAIKQILEESNEK